MESGESGGCKHNEASADRATTIDDRRGRRRRSRGCTGVGRHDDGRRHDDPALRPQLDPDRSQDAKEREVHQGQEADSENEEEEVRCDAIKFKFEVVVNIVESILRTVFT